MNRNPVKQRLAAGKVVVGPYVHEFYTAGLPKIVAATGADFVIFDQEHSGWSTESLRTQLLLAHGAGLVPIVNCPGAAYLRDGLFLDIGAMGLMVPHVQTAEQARAIVAGTRYSPAGNRGGAFGIAHDGYRQDEPATVIADANDSILIIAKLESAAAIENAEAIMAVPGIDVALVTGFDLSLDLRIAGQLDHPDILRATEKVLEICARTGKSAGCAAFNLETALKRQSEGYRFIQYSWDIGLLQTALRAGVDALRTD
jgi:2-dehydro-3-deoxyglucarate aldolase/4-hydroxy-2-oxoheptanedioate aldolase